MAGATDRCAPVVEDQGLVDASAEDQLVGGAPSSLGFASPLAPTVEPEAVEPRRSNRRRLFAIRTSRDRPLSSPSPRAKRGRRKRDRAPADQALPPAISAPEWARMSPGARRLYGVDGAAAG